MKISTKGRYGSRAMLALAGRYGGNPMSASEIALQQGISQKYLESILTVLKTAGLVTVRRGNAGGYMLSRDPKDITLYDILLPLEDFLGIVHCVDGDCDCERYVDCYTREVWQEMKDANEKILRKKSLAGLLARKRTKQKKR